METSYKNTMQYNMCNFIIYFKIKISLNKGILS